MREEPPIGPSGEVHRFWFKDLSETAVLLQEKVVATGALKLARGLLRKGKGMTGQFHDYNLSDDVFRLLEAQELSCAKDDDRCDDLGAEDAHPRSPAVQSSQRRGHRRPFEVADADSDECGARQVLVGLRRLGLNAGLAHRLGGEGTAYGPGIGVGDVPSSDAVVEVLESCPVLLAESEAASSSSPRPWVRR